MKKTCATALVACAAATGIYAGTGTASAATLIADVSIRPAPTSPGALCSVSVGNAGPDTVNVTIIPSNTFEKVYIRTVESLAPGTSVTVDYPLRCQALESDKVLILFAVGFDNSGNRAADTDPTNNVLPLLPPTPGTPTPAPAQPRFGSS